MIDIYKKLNISVGASAEDIQRKMAQTHLSPELKKTVECVLLIASRRRQYDEVRQTLVAVGQLRANLGLNRTSLWLEQDYADFDAAPTTSGSLLAAFATTPRSRTQDSLSDAKLPNWVTASVLTGLVALVLAEAVLDPKGGSQALPAMNSVDPEQLLESPPSTVLRSLQEPLPAAFNQPELPFPKDGVLDHVAPGISQGAPFEVKTAKGSAYFVKLVALGTNRAVLTAFLRGGEAFEALVPTGRYELRYASGQTWYGPEHLFGPDTVYSKADQIFEFQRTREGYVGVSVELILQASGNLQTVAIAPSSF
jgi:hypothetical protein